MKNFKWALMSLVAVLMTVIGSKVFANADTYTLTLNGTTTGHTYEVYQIFSGDLSNSTLSNIKWGTGVSAEGQAALGDEVDVPTVHGKVKLKVPAGTQSGTILRLRGKGAPKLRGTGNGDQHVEVIVDTPKKLTDKQRQALQVFANEEGTQLHNGEENFFDKMKNAFKDTFE